MCESIIGGCHDRLNCVFRDRGRHVYAEAKAVSGCCSGVPVGWRQSSWQGQRLLRSCAWNTGEIRRELAEHAANVQCCRASPTWQIEHAVVSGADVLPCRQFCCTAVCRKPDEWAAKKLAELEELRAEKGEGWWISNGSKMKGGYMSGVTRRLKPRKGAAADGAPRPNTPPEQDKAGGKSKGKKRKQASKDAKAAPKKRCAGASWVGWGAQGNGGTAGALKLKIGLARPHVHVLLVCGC